MVYLNTAYVQLPDQPCNILVVQSKHVYTKSSLPKAYIVCRDREYERNLNNTITEDIARHCLPQTITSKVRPHQS